MNNYHGMVWIRSIMSIFFVIILHVYRSLDVANLFVIYISYIQQYSE